MRILHIIFQAPLQEPLSLILASVDGTVKASIQPLILSPTRLPHKDAQQHKPEQRRQEGCHRCRGTGRIKCQSCSDGRLRRGGYHERNTVNTSRLVGSKWTAMQRTLGWRHFHVTDKRKAAGETFICMVSTCNNDTKMWLNTSVLKSRSAWAPGWLQREEILNAQEPGPECKACNGHGSLPCMRCSSGGAIIHI
ncbi:g11620 [Coccomyxa viridis]|uniref:G11620 protein n=1 Tax=Coccomyxa viridis TaxID=1274662 RepID=A0ABP1GFE3_9CHLO